MKRSRYLFICILIVGILTAPVGAQTLKMASIAPQNSSWGRILERIAGHFQQTSNGDIKVRIFHNSLAGGERDVLRKMRLRQIDIGIFTSLGIGEIAPEVLAISAPGLYANHEELEYVFSSLEPEFRESINEGRFELIGINIVGWIYPFATEPFRTPEELVKNRFATSATNSGLTKQLRTLGFNVVALDFSEWLTGLNNGLVGAFFGSPVAAAGFQWFGIADNMLNFPISPFLGAIVITDSAWEKIPPDSRPRLLSLIQREMSSLADESLKLDSDSIMTMQNFGLNVIEISESERDRWLEFMSVEQVITESGDAVIDSSTYEKIRSLIRAYRSQS